jgi:hypothetical protein
LDGLVPEDNNSCVPHITTKAFANGHGVNPVRPKCSGKGCLNPAEITLKIRFINKIGTFCKNCADDLLSEGLAFKKV